MAQVLALDIGTVRIGIAIGDEAVRIAFPKAVLPRAQNKAERAIMEIVQQEGISALVIGLPLDERGGETPQCEDIRRYTRRLERRVAIPTYFVDESHTSEEALELLTEIDPSGSRGREFIDACAAACILERYFSSLP